MFVIESDATIVAPLLLSALLTFMEAMRARFDVSIVGVRSLAEEVRVWAAKGSRGAFEGEVGPTTSPPAYTHS